MKAVVYTRYGPPDVLRLTDVQTPVPKDDEVLVQVHAVSLNATDWEVLRGKPLFGGIHLTGLESAHDAGGWRALSAHDWGVPCLVPDR